MARRPSSTRGFARTSSLLQSQIRRTSESRGFAQSRLLTHWAEIAGEETAAISRPVEIGYGRGGVGATLTLLTNGANAPILEMQKVQLRERVNAVYGYNAIARIRITQTSAVGFSEGQADFEIRPKRKPAVQPDAATLEHARATTGGVADDGLRSALERLATNIISRSRDRG